MYVKFIFRKMETQTSAIECGYELHTIRQVLSRTEIVR